MDSDTYASPPLSVWQTTVLSQSDLEQLKRKKERIEAHTFSEGLLWTQGSPCDRSCPGNSKKLFEESCQTDTYVVSTYTEQWVYNCSNSTIYLP